MFRFSFKRFWVVFFSWIKAFCLFKKRWPYVFLWKRLGWALLLPKAMFGSMKIYRGRKMPFLVLKICFTNMPYRFSSGVLFSFFLVFCRTNPKWFSRIPQMIFKNSKKNSSTILKLFMNPPYVSQPFHLILGCKFIL